MELDFDLDIRNYQSQDLLSLFKLPATFTSLDVDVKEQAIRVQLMTEDMPRELKGSLDNFLSAASELIKKDWLQPKMLPNDLIPSSTIPYVPARVEEFTRGTINPYDKRSLTKLVSVDSLYRANYATTFACDMQLPIPETLRNVVSMELDQIDLPCTFYPTFSSQAGTSVFYISVTLVPLGTATNYTITLPNGNYSAVEFEAVVNQTLTALSLDFLLCFFEQGKVRFRAKAIGESGNLYEAGPNYYPAFTYTVTFKPGEASAGKKMGFAGVTYPAVLLKNILDEDDMVIATYRNYVAAEGYLINEGCTYFFLEVDDYHNNFQTNALVTNQPGFSSNNVFARISLFNGRLSISRSKREYMGPVRIEKLHLRLLSEHGEVVSWVRDYSVSLRFTVIYS